MCLNLIATGIRPVCSRDDDRLSTDDGDGDEDTEERGERGEHRFRGFRLPFGLLWPLVFVLLLRACSRTVCVTRWRALLGRCFYPALATRRDDYGSGRTEENLENLRERVASRRQRR